MRHRLLVPLLCCSAWFIQTAHAKPPVIDRNQAVAGPRSDPGTGLCGNATHFVQPNKPLNRKDEATMLLDEPAGDPSILGRTQRIFDTINFRNGQPGASGDFRPPHFPKAVFPYSLDEAASPMGNDINIALRLRGYFNVPDSLAGKTISFGINCDDFCELTIGTTTVIPWADERLSARVLKQVTFGDAGLYPVELVYYQNGSTAYLEWSRTADMPVADCPNDICGTSLTDPMYMSKFDLVARTDLYSAIVGTSTACTECGGAGMPSCPTGSYCGDGLCQGCATAAHCGADCRKCPADAAICAEGECVQCVTDDQCPAGQRCDSAHHRCLPPGPPPPPPPPRCMRAGDCPTGQECNPDTHLCGSPSACRPEVAGTCPTGQVCDSGSLHCVMAPATCQTDADCGDVTASYCDLTDVSAPRCQPRSEDSYVGGQAGCSAGASNAPATPAAALFAVLALGLLGHRRRVAVAGRRDSRRSASG